MGKPRVQFHHTSVAPATTPQERLESPLINAATMELVQQFFTIPETLQKRVFQSFLLSVMTNIDNAAEVWDEIDGDLRLHLPMMLDIRRKHEEITP